MYLVEVGVDGIHVEATVRCVAVPVWELEPS